MITDSTVVGRSPHTVTAIVRDETVILNDETGYFVQLNPSGTRIWHLIETPQRVSMLCKSLVDRYDVTVDACRLDTLTFLNEIDAKGMITRA